MVNSTKVALEAIISLSAATPETVALKGSSPVILLPSTFRVVLPTLKDVYKRQGQEGLRPSSEMKMHLRCYEKRPDVMCVVHAHPPGATGFAVAHKAMDMYNMIEDCLLYTSRCV